MPAWADSHLASGVPSPIASFLAAFPAPSPDFRFVGGILCKKDCRTQDIGQQLGKGLHTEHEMNDIKQQSAVSSFLGPQLRQLSSNGSPLEVVTN